MDALVWKRVQHRVPGRVDIVIMVMRPSETIVLYDGIHVFCTDGSTVTR